MSASPGYAGCGKVDLGPDTSNVFIRQLTGIRFVAAAWVVLYHYQGPLATAGLLPLPVVSDTLRVGRLGVDLFFALSGFILTHTYMSGMGRALHGRSTIRFWWLRLARIYPVHVVMLVVAGLAVVLEAKVAGQEPDRAWLNPVDFAKNLLLVQEWGSAPSRGWNFVAWSLSMEWLAYLFFPLLALVLWALHRGAPTWSLVVLWGVALTPLMAYGLSTADPYYGSNWGSTYRILSEFTAGAITYLVVRRLLQGGPTSSDPAPRVERVASILSVLLPLLVVAGAVFLANWPPAQPPGTTPPSGVEPLPPYYHLLLVPFLVAWIGALALSRRGFARWLSTRALVLGGFISYSLYMTHVVWLGLWRAALEATGLDGGLVYTAAVALLLLGSLGIAWLMWRLIEEPAREWMRRLAGSRPTPTEEAGEAIAETKGDPSGAAPVQLKADP